MKSRGLHPAGRQRHPAPTAATAPTDAELNGALSFLRERVEAEFSTLNEPLAAEEPEPSATLKPGQSCVLANIGGALVHAEIVAAQREACSCVYLPLLQKLTTPEAAATGVEATFVKTRTRTSKQTRTHLTAEAHTWFGQAETLLAPRLTERSMLNCGKHSLNEAIMPLYRDAALGDSWLALVGKGNSKDEHAVRVGLKLRLLRRLAHTRAKAHVKSMKERLRVLGIGVRAGLKAKKSAKAKRAQQKQSTSASSAAAAAATPTVAAPAGHESSADESDLG